MSFRVLIALCALAVTGCVAQSVDPCEQLTNCTAPIANFGSLEGLQSFDNMNASDVLDLMCGEVEASHRCVDNVRGLCLSQGEMSNTRVLLEIGDHICDDDNRNDMEDLFQSDCLTNVTVGAHFASELQSCGMTFASQVQQVAMSQYRNRHIRRRPDYTLYCPLFNDLETCMIGVAISECGEIAGETASAIWDIAIRHSMPRQLRGCFTDVQASRRALEHVMPAMAKRHFENLDWLLGALD